MKIWRRWFGLILAFILVLNFSLSGTIQAFAHSAILAVGYDDCEIKNNDDDIDQMWYVLAESGIYGHLSHEETTIKYYFSDSSIDDFYTWTSNGVSGDLAQEIKNAYADSMKKWNNVYFYTYNYDGTVTKNKIINIVPGTYDDYNLIIYPTWGTNAIASTGATGTADDIIEEDGTTHKHYSQWNMIVDISDFYVNNSRTAEEVEVLRERTGAHEMGHILGLLDVDNLCNASSSGWHHHELLMGYGEPITDRMADITYKDIAGVAITRGFHTDDDHQWLNCGVQSNGKYKWLCAICNGTKVMLHTGSHPDYGSCGGVHTLSGGKMMAVASYGTTDYYKCKYCKYVAPFESNVEQNYVKTYVTATQHQCYNDVTGLDYTTYEPHEYIITYKDRLSHAGVCACGYEIEGRHWIKETEIVGGRYGQCATCGALIDLGDDIVEVGPLNIAKVSVNGSYLLANGIAVIVDEDVEAYINGTLVFYDIDDVPVTQ